MHEILNIYTCFLFVILDIFTCFMIEHALIYMSFGNIMCLFVLQWRNYPSNITSNNYNIIAIKYVVPLQETFQVLELSNIVSNIMK